ncbi:MAG TPA: PH domain-containing protein [Gemmatimonadales bacterium]|nr:PH domain-containing protein [Gemmatimonadales bacterium]
MGYLDDHLLAGERIVYRARRHWIVFMPTILLLLLAAGILVLSFVLHPTAAQPELRRWLQWMALGIAVLGLVVAVGPWIRWMSSEYAVTDKRVLAKLGVVQRDSLETLLSKIEAIRVDQSVWGRLWNYGTITVIGTGGTEESFDLISHPLEFRRQVQAQIIAQEERRGALAGAATAAAAAATEPREERECPWCAERILARAKVCRFCGREVGA